MTCPPRLRLLPRLPNDAVWLAVVLAVAFVWLSQRRLWHTDLWGHLAHGRLIWQTGSLPATEPFMPLAAGRRMIDSAWLSQLVGYAAIESAGVAGVQALYAAGVTACLALLVLAIYARMRNAVVALLGGAAFFAVGWQHLTIVRPQLAGTVCFTALLAWLTSRRPGRLSWLGVPLLFVVWANSHGSFVTGLALLAAFAVGRAVDVVYRTGSLRALGRDRRARYWLLLTVAAASAALVNPYGWRLYVDVLTFSGNPNLRGIVEWKPLTVWMPQGQLTVLVCGLLGVAYWFTSRRVSIVEPLALGGLGLGALWTSRLIIWWAPVAAWFLVLHGSAVLRSFAGWRRLTRPPRPSAAATMAVGVCALAALLATPLARQSLLGRPQPLESAVSRDTPVAATRWLRENPPAGQMFNAMEWGDYLIWAGPPGVRVFVASHVHLVPVKVWNDYLRVVAAQTGWELILAKYDVRTVMIDKRYRRTLIEALRDNPRWRVAYEDPIAMIFVRRE